MTTTSTPRLTKQTAQFLEILFSQLDSAQSHYVEASKHAVKFDTGEIAHDENSCSVWSNEKMADKHRDSLQDEYFAIHLNLGVALNDMFPSVRKEAKGCVTKAIHIVRNQMARTKLEA